MKVKLVLVETSFLPKKLWKKNIYATTVLSELFKHAFFPVLQNVWNLTLDPFSYCLVSSGSSFPLLLIISKINFLLRDWIFCSFENRHFLILKPNLRKHLCRYIWLYVYIYMRTNICILCIYIYIYICMYICI